MPETLIEHRDVTGTLLHFTTEQITRMMYALPDEQRRFARLMAETIKHPHEIWQRWMRDEKEPQQWHKVRYYLRYLDLSETEIKGGFGVVAMQFAGLDRWELSGAGIVLGEHDSVMARIDAEARQGDIEYSNTQH